MLVTTTPSVEGRPIHGYLGIVTGSAVVPAPLFKGYDSGDLADGRYGRYERALGDARRMALDELEEDAAELSADAIVGVGLNDQVLGKHNELLMVTASGTAVKLG